MAFDGHQVTLWDKKHHVAYILPVAHHASAAADAAKKTHTVPSIAAINRGIARLGKVAVVSGAIPGNVAGQKAYTVRLAPRHNGGLFGNFELAWDAARGVPLHFAIYPHGSSTAAIAITVTHIHYGPVSAARLALTPPAGTKIVHVHMPTQQSSKDAHTAHASRSVTGAAAVQRAVGFQLAAPAKLAGLLAGRGALGGRRQDAGSARDLREGPRHGVRARAARHHRQEPGGGAARGHGERGEGARARHDARLARAVHARRHHLHRGRLAAGGDDHDRGPSASVSGNGGDAEPLIEIEGVTKRYGGIVALEDVSATLRERAVGLLGANGAGKSTLMRVMLGLIKADAGRVSVLGIDASRPSWDVRRLLGYMPEHSCLPLGMTARDLVVHMGELRGLPRRVAVLRASEVLFQVGLEEERSRLIRTFSVGMKQRTNLAQAIVHSPGLVILDEPTNGLDPAGREEMLTLVRRLSAELGIAVVMSSHVLEDVARTCDSVIVLREGRVAATRPIDHTAAAVQGDLQVRIAGDAGAFARAAAAIGLTVQADGDGDAAWLHVRGPDADGVCTGVRDAAVAAGVGLQELRPAGPTLEESLIGAIG